MLIRLSLSFVLVAGIPAWCQVAAPGGIFANEESTPMTAPPPVSGQPYPTLAGSEVQANFFNAGLTYSTSYIDNVFPGAGLQSHSDVVYSVWPEVSLNQMTSRQHLDLTYRPGYSFYQRTSELNEFDQALTADYNFRWTPHLTLHANDLFGKSRGILYQTGSLLGQGVSPTGPVATGGAIAPYADQITNTLNGGIDLQTGRNTMVGVAGGYWFLNYPHPSQATGLFNSHSRTGSAFYTGRLSQIQYFGVNYRYAQMFASPAGSESETRTHTVSLFYTVVPTDGLSLSITVGPQRYLVSQTGLPTSSSWTPSVTTSIGWQGARSTFAISYAREVTGGGGLLGAFRSDTAEAGARWVASPRWEISATGGYILNKSVTPVAFLATPGGHTLTATAALERHLSQQLRVKFEYDHLHQSYANIPSIASNPDSNSGMVTVSWQLNHPLGR